MLNRSLHYGFLIINSKGILKMWMKIVQFQDVLKQLLFNKASLDELKEQHITELISQVESFVNVRSFRLLEEEKELRHIAIANNASGCLSKYLMVDFDSTTTGPGSGTKCLLDDAIEDQVDMTLG